MTKKPLGTEFLAQVSMSMIKNLKEAIGDNKRAKNSVPNGFFFIESLFFPDILFL